MKEILYTTLILIALTLATACGSTPKPSTEQAPKETTYAPGTRTMKRSRPDIYSVTTRQEYEDMVATYWDDFDFDSPERIAEYDTLDIIFALSDYVTVIPPYKADSLLRNLMSRASAHRPTLDFFAMVMEVVLHDPNSPVRNDEYYIPVLETLLASPLLDDYDRIAPQYDLALAKQNRIMHVANDFVYTTANGKRSRLHAITADYVILMFSNPGCPMCREITEEICASPLLNEMQERGTVQILSLYPDADLVAWRDHLGDMPQGWIKGYDDGLVISSQRLYNLNAIPSLYLLDSEKRVLIKDGTSVAQIENTIALVESNK